MNNKADLIRSIGVLGEKIAAAAMYLALFIVMVALSAVLVVLTVIPWAVRVGSVLGWAAVLYIEGMSLYRFYSSYANDTSVIALILAAVVLAISIPAQLFQISGERELVWGGFAVAALIGLVISWIADNAASSLELRMAVSALPPLAVGAMLVKVGMDRKRRSRADAGGQGRSGGEPAPLP